MRTIGRVIVPVMEHKMQSYPKIRVLYQLGDDFSGYTAEALWDDAKLGMHHFHAFEKAAVVTEVDWIRKSVSFFRFLIPCPVRIFPNNEFPAALDWINSWDKKQCGGFLTGWRGSATITRNNGPCRSPS